ncbi:MAG TPA: universal stress protein [Gemmatimonas aurantiaca]|uniref:Universal stress protein n=2 Tax=Gemmatimonas aurantiaca TaxID=173480 RepID=C1AAF7_GEMAT|nr:universal stress protein [Gemmatimonas aurantiaca]BAH39755.1 universal stress protein [Gemmatimonas aurantiaca T-27]HCT58236.1 universal stress protein [Gemmatimonas aurantiaca]
MYRRILVPLEHSPYDDVIIAHVRQLATLCKSSLLLMHVADGWAARHQKSLQLRESEEMRVDREYLEGWCATLRGEGFEADSILAGGDPASEIAAAADREHCDLIAMAVHGHRGLQDVIYGTTANTVRHRTMVPVLMVRGPAGLRLAGRPR